MKINVLNLGRNITQTKDNVKLTVDSSIAYRITNPIIAYYVLGNNWFNQKEQISIEHWENQLLQA
jgi:regulator of protease activity HflC (stomatin/prohibitin superfamily)